MLSVCENARSDPARRTGDTIWGPEGRGSRRVSSLRQVRGFQSPGKCPRPAIISLHLHLTSSANMHLPLVRVCLQRRRSLALRELCRIKSAWLPLLFPPSIHTAPLLPALVFIFPFSPYARRSASVTAPQVKPSAHVAQDLTDTSLYWYHSDDIKVPEDYRFVKSKMSPSYRETSAVMNTTLFWTTVGCKSLTLQISSYIHVV